MHCAPSQFLQTSERGWGSSAVALAVRRCRQLFDWTRKGMGHPAFRGDPVVLFTLSVCLIFLRWLVFWSYGDDLQQRVELSNAFNGFRGIKEALALLHYGVSPYSGTVRRSCLLRNSTIHCVVCDCHASTAQDLESGSHRWQLSQ